LIVESGTGLLLVGRELADHSMELLDRREMERAAGQERAGQVCWMGESWTGLRDRIELNRRELSEDLMELLDWRELNRAAG
jgi:hypothetical protein